MEEPKAGEERHLGDLGRNKHRKTEGQGDLEDQVCVSSGLVSTCVWPCPVSAQCSLSYFLKILSNSFLGEGCSVQCACVSVGA